MVKYLILLLVICISSPVFCGKTKFRETLEDNNGGRINFYEKEIKDGKLYTYTINYYGKYGISTIFVPKIKGE